MNTKFTEPKGYSYKRTSTDKEVYVQTGYLARDKSKALYLYSEKPYRHKANKDVGYEDTWQGYIITKIDSSSFKNLKWEDDPVKVTIAISII